MRNFSWITRSYASNSLLSGEKTSQPSSARRSKMRTRKQATSSFMMLSLSDVLLEEVFRDSAAELRAKHKGPVGHPINVLRDDARPRPVDGDKIVFRMEQRALVRGDVASDSNVHRLVLVHAKREMRSVSACSSGLARPCSYYMHSLPASCTAEGGSRSLGSVWPSRCLT